MPRHRSTPSRLPVRTSFGIAFLCPPFDSAAGGKVQPAAQQLRHLQGHEHGLHVLRALRACPLCPPSLESGLPRACRWRCAIAPHTLLPPGQPGPHRVPSFRLGRWLFSSTSHSAPSTPPRSRTWSPCSMCARALPPKPFMSWIHAVRTALRRNQRTQKHFRLPRPAPRSALYSFLLCCDSAGRVGVQPDA